MTVARIGRMHWWLEGSRVVARCPECGRLTTVDPGVTSAGRVRPLLECRCGASLHVELLTAEDPSDPQELQTSAPRRP